MEVKGINLEGVLPIFYREVRGRKIVFCQENGRIITEPKNLEEAEDFLLAICLGLMNLKNKDYLKNFPSEELRLAYQLLETYLENVEKLGYKTIADNRKIQKELKSWG